MLIHFLKFLGMLTLLSVLAQCVPYGCLIGTAVVLCGIWKLTE